MTGFVRQSVAPEVAEILLGSATSFRVVDACTIAAVLSPPGRHEPTTLYVGVEGGALGYEFEYPASS